VHLTPARFIAIDLTFSVSARVVGVAAIAPDVPTAFIIIFAGILRAIERVISTFGLSVQI
jgi:hypothetical protein